MIFRKYGFNETNAQTYDRKKIKAKKCGKEYNVYDEIQAQNIDTDIKEVLKKYHCSMDAAIEIMQSRGGVVGIYSDIVELQEKAQDLPSLMKLQNYVQEQFDQLPLELKQKYGNNPEEFLKNAEIEFKKLQKESEPLNNKEPDNANK